MDPSATPEHELKLAVDEDFRLPEIGTPLPSRTFVSTYYDTDDLLLARVGLTLRRRLEKGENAWQLKLPREDHRLEVESPGGAADPPPEIARLLTGVLRGRDLQRVAELRTRREGVRVDGVADVVLDSVAVLESRRVRDEFRELEVEALDGSARGLRQIERTLRRAGARDGDPRPKVMRTLELPAEETPPARDAPGSEHLRAAIGTHVKALLAHDPGVRVGDDPEDVHQARVATRRLRALLRTARESLDEKSAARLQAELRWLGGALGAVRDLDVLLGELEQASGALDAADAAAVHKLIRPLENERKAARKELLEVMDGERYRELLDALELTAKEPPLHAELDAPAVAAAEFRRLRKAVSALPEDPADDELHALRIRGKRARYAAELAEGILGRPAARFIRRAKDFQDVIGEHQDAVVAEERLRALAAAAASHEAFVAGRLVERQRDRRRAARDAWPAAWKRLEQTGRRAFA